MKRLLLIVLLLLLVPVLTVGWFLWRGGMESAPRREWKNTAVTEIESRVADDAWISAEAQRLQEQASPRGGDWFSDEMVLAKNGDWMICRSVCAKEPARIEDLFIGRGSDGKWYYSTFHFCIDKVSLAMEPQPATLADFVHGYWLAPFDGRSDDSLKATWTSGPYGLGRP